MSGLLGKDELVVRVLKDFHASSVLLLDKDVWRVVSREDFCSWDRDFGVVIGSLLWGGCCCCCCCSCDWDGVLCKAKIEGWRKE